MGNADTLEQAGVAAVVGAAPLLNSAPQREFTPEEEAAVIESKTLRVELDATLQRLKSSPRNSRSRSLAVTKLQEGIMWLGMDLKELNDGRSCYPDSYDPSNSRVAPTADGLKL